MKNSSGFTLLELLISIALVAILLTGITGLGSRFVGNIHSNQEKQNEVESIYTTLHLINQDMMSYYSNFTGSLNSISMLTVKKALQDNISTSGQLRVGYRVVSKDGQQILYRKTKDNLIRTTGIETEVMRSAKIYFSFIGENLEELPSWQSSAKGSAPVAVKIIIQDESEREWHRTIPLMVRFNNDV